MSENKILAKVLSALYGKKILEKNIKDYEKYHKAQIRVRFLDRLLFKKKNENKRKICIRFATISYNNEMQLYECN